MSDNSEALRRARAADSQARLARCESVLRRMVTAGQPVTVAEVARRANVGEKFAYRHPVLKAKIDEAKRAVARQRLRTWTGRWRSSATSGRSGPTICSVAWTGR